MQVIILAGGTGTRLREMTEFLPKALVPIGGIPMITHIMRWYMHYGYEQFILALGYKQEAFKQYFSLYDTINNDCTLNIGKYRGEDYREFKDSFRVTMVDTGENTFKGGRLKRVERYIEGDTFMMCYGDGIGDIDIKKLLAFHQAHGKLVTVTGVHPQPRFGEIHHDKGNVISFSEKPEDDCLVNGGFYVFNRGIFDYLTEDSWCDLEHGPLELLANKGEMRVYQHKGYWGCMDTIKDMEILNTLWEEGKAKWRVSNV
jgi:glucose-1-phosphate cytidylyltransferase